MWAELSEARLIPSLAQTRHKHTNKLPRDHSALSSRCWRPPAPCQPLGHVLPGERGLRRTSTGETPAGTQCRGDTARPARAGDIQGRSSRDGAPVSRRGMSSAALQPWAPAGPGRSRRPSLSTGIERRGCLSLSLSFLLSNKSRTRAQPAAPAAPPPGGRVPAGPPSPGAARRRPGRARSAGNGATHGS